MISYFFAIITILLILIILFGSHNLPFYQYYAIENDRSNGCPIWEKQQWVRLLDIFVLGPTSLYIAYHIFQGIPLPYPKVIGLLMSIYGTTTIVYNFSNYYNNLKKIQ
jgi:hypothetical protein